MTFVGSAGSILLETRSTFQESSAVSFSTVTLGGGQNPQGEEVTFLPSIGYFRVEFPSEFWYFQNVATISTTSLAQFFVELLPKDDPRIEHVYWFSEDEVLKVWTVIAEPDFSVEQPIYEAEMLFMEKFPEYACDFSVIYRFGKSFDDIKPQDGHLVF